MLKTVGFPSTRTGDQTIVAGNLVIGTAGKGIDFSADPSAPGMTSELLDDYEEGTFTPTIIGLTTAGVGTYTTQVGRYTKIGNRVYFAIYLNWSAHTGTGNMYASGLPFTVNDSSFPAVSLYQNAISLTANYTMQGYVNNSTTQVLLAQVNSSGSVSLIPIDTSGILFISGQYTV